MEACSEAAGVGKPELVGYRLDGLIGIEKKTFRCPESIASR